MKDKRRTGTVVSLSKTNERDRSRTAFETWREYRCRIMKKQLNGAGLRQRMAPEKLEIGVEGGD